MRPIQSAQLDLHNLSEEEIAAMIPRTKDCLEVFPYARTIVFLLMQEGLIRPEGINNEVIDEMLFLVFQRLAENDSVQAIMHGLTDSFFSCYANSIAMLCIQHQMTVSQLLTFTPPRLSIDEHIFIMVQLHALNQCFLINPTNFSDILTTLSNPETLSV